LFERIFKIPKFLAAVGGAVGNSPNLEGSGERGEGVHEAVLVRAGPIWSGRHTRSARHDPHRELLVDEAHRYAVDGVEEGDEVVEDVGGEVAEACHAEISEEFGLSKENKRPVFRENTEKTILVITAQSKKAFVS
jgi:hypothetical protein